MKRKRTGILRESLFLLVLLGAVITFGFTISRMAKSHTSRENEHPVGELAFTPITPSATFLNAKAQMPSPEPGAPADIVRRPAGAGTIIEDGLAPYPASYFFENRWYAKIGQEIIIVYAGAQRSDGVTPLEEPWPGIVVVDVSGSDEKGGAYFTPVKAGPVRISDVNGMQLTLVTDSGSVFLFDVTSRKFVSSGSPAIVNRAVGVGTLIESGISSFPKGHYVFKNQWSEEAKGMHITVFAGAENQVSDQGILVIDETAIGNPSAASGQQVYRTPVAFGPVWIATVDGEKLTLATRTGGKFIFDVASRQFTFSPEAPVAEPTPTPFPVLVAPIETGSVTPTPATFQTTPYP